MAERKRAEALKAKTASKAGSPGTPEPEVGLASAGDDPEGEVQLSLRLRPELKTAILDAARQRRITVKQLVLGALRDAGLPVEDSDLLDRRDGAPRRPRRDARSATVERPSVGGPYSAPRSDEMRTSMQTPDLVAFAAMIRDLAGRRTGAGNGPNIRISTGCCCGHRSTSKRNSTNSRQRRK
jgi:hypothetical protein